MDEPESPSLFPFFETLEDGVTYKWCACGRSKTQPFCDGSHEGTGFEPVELTRETTRKVSLCGCKRTKRPPYCDGSHRQLMAPEDREREERFPAGLPITDEHSREVDIGSGCPDLPVADCPAAIRYYCEVLGFRKYFDDAELGFERTLYAGVERGDLRLVLDWHRRGELPCPVHVMARVDDVDALYAELTGRGAKISEELTDHPWGERSFSIEDPNGHILAFTMAVKPA